MKYAETKKIFISYRVQDTSGETGRLVDSLRQHFAEEQIFLDIETLEPGSDFTEAIGKSLDTCHVFLAVIGPRWTGDGDNRRINEPEDWVRMEVSTALNRNIRVVPVLVDGAKLPKAEDLPPELHPLLRRQSLEISNKRWQYDTDKLVHFLINTAGIEPKRPIQPSPPEPVVSTAKNRTWLYVGSGFGLAMLVLIILAVVLPEEKEIKPPNPQPIGRDTTNPTHGGDIIYPIQNDDNFEIFTGSWKEVDQGETSTFHLSPNGNGLGVQIELLGEIIGTGTGSVDGENLELNFTLMGIPTILRATLSTDNSTLHGTYFIQTNGMQQPVRLMRIATE